jgi:hypothetical protein
MTEQERPIMTTKYTSPHAAAAKMIRQDLKKHFPATKFRVTTKSYSGGDHVRIRWTDGPTDKQVSSLVNRYEYGHFDGMQDLYEYSNRRDDIPQTKYLFTEREHSVAEIERAAAEINAKYGYALQVAYSTDWETGAPSAYIEHTADHFERNTAYRMLQETSYEDDAIRFQPQPDLTGEEMESLQNRFAGIDLQRYENHA